MQYVELYTRAPVHYTEAEVREKLPEGAVNAIVVLSVESLACLIDIVKSAGKLEHYQTLPLVVPSDRVAAEASDQGFEKVHNSRGADDSSIRSALWEIRENADILG